MDKKVTLYQVSSLEKVYLDYAGPQLEIQELSLLRNEKASYQIAYLANIPLVRRNMKITVDSPLKAHITVRQVGNVPVELPIRVEADEHYERCSPGMYPDVLYPLESDSIDVLYGPWHSLWITISLDGSIKAGRYPITVSLSDDEVTESKTLYAQVIDAFLPEQELIFTQWFHADCLADYYKLSVFSEEHWRKMDQFIKTAAENGINMMLTPIFTPPLDTAVGGERTTVQLVDVIKTGDAYTFGFDKLRRYIRLCLKNGIRYIEISHLFTQWGLKNAPKVIAESDGQVKQIFGLDTDANDEKYIFFLSQLLPALDQVLKEEGVYDRTFFHISDEPYIRKLLFLRRG